jgi:DNA-binding MarR family transcriptional regulator
MERDRDLHRRAAQDRQAALEEIERERAHQATIAEQRLEAMELVERSRRPDDSDQPSRGWS